MTADRQSQTLQLPLIALRLRALVLALGESTKPPWWKTEFMNETGLRYLERLYPRTALRAAIYAAGRAASDVHDRAVGRVGVYHLFRLPESLETDLNRSRENSQETFNSAFRAALGQADKLLELLTPLRGHSKADIATGARRLGTGKDMLTAAGFESMTAVYHAAFTQGKPCFPYFAADQPGNRR